MNLKFLAGVLIGGVLFWIIVWFVNQYEFRKKTRRSRNVLEVSGNVFVHVGAEQDRDIITDAIISTSTDSYFGILARSRALTYMCAFGMDGTEDQNELVREIVKAFASVLWVGLDDEQKKAAREAAPQLKVFNNVF